MNPLRRWYTTHGTLIAGARAAAVGAVIVASAGLILHTVHPHYPIDAWLFWRYASYWGVTAFFGAACLSVGHRINGWLGLGTTPMGEQLATSMALGVFTFFVGMFIAGLLGLYGPILALAWPTALLASGLWPLVRRVRCARRHLQHAGLLRPRVSLLQILFFSYGLLALGAIYFSMLTPQNAAYDAQWYHLPIAEHYAAQGGIAPFPEGWYPGTGPHLASVLYTWSFLLPGTRLFDRVLLSAHLEVLLFVCTLAAIPPLVRRLLHGRRAPFAWVATFLFPGLFLYDASLCLGADHIAAFWAIPIFLVLLRFWRNPRPRYAIALALFISGAVLTKYTATMLVVLPIIAALARSFWVAAASAVRSARDWERSRKASLALLAFAVSGAIATMPHWLKNWIWYGDPLYPILHAHTHPHPWTPESAAYYHAAITNTLFRPDGDSPIRSTLEMIFTFAFKPHDWPQFHGNIPVFGFLFTLGTVTLLFFRRTGRTWALVLATWAALATWTWTHAEDRYLQAVLPWMVAVAASALVLVWRTHWTNRVWLAALVALQVIWGGDVYFFRTHTMIHDSPAKASIDMIAAGHEKGKAEKRLEPFGSWNRIGKALPPHAKVLVHEEHYHLGLRAMSVNDWPGIQGGLSYGRLGSIAAIHRRFVDWGITHIAWTARRSLAYDSLAGDLLFFRYATQVAVEPKTYGKRRLARVPSAAPADRGGNLVLYLGCSNTYEPGLYEIGTMIVPERVSSRKDYPPPKQAVRVTDLEQVRALAQRATYLVHAPACAKSVGHGLFAGFVKVARRKKRVDLWVRREKKR